MIGVIPFASSFWMIASLGPMRTYFAPRAASWRISNSSRVVERSGNRKPFGVPWGARPPPVDGGGGGGGGGGEEAVLLTVTVEDARASSTEFELKATASSVC